MGITKTDFIRGMQCPKMLWLDSHKREKREIPLEVRERLDDGNVYGDSLMGIFGSYTEVQEYYPGTKHPDKVRMAAKTAELIAAGTEVICEGAFMDSDGNYCAVDILRWDKAPPAVMTSMKSRTRKASRTASSWTQPSRPI